MMRWEKLNPGLATDQNEPSIVQLAMSKILKSTYKFMSYEETQAPLTILETLMKERKNLVLEEIDQESNCEIFAKLILTTPYEWVRLKMAALIQIWAFMFKDPAKYSALVVSSGFVDHILLAAC
jgi:hypothetical protein